MCARLKQKFSPMTEESLFAEQCASHQICCSLSRALKSANRVDIDMFNSPKFTQFRDTYACIKPFLVLLLPFCICMYIQVF